MCNQSKHQMLIVNQTNLAVFVVSDVGPTNKGYIFDFVQRADFCVGHLILSYQTLNGLGCAKIEEMVTALAVVAKIVTPRERIYLSVNIFRLKIIQCFLRWETRLSRVQARFGCSRFSTQKIEEASGWKSLLPGKEGVCSLARDLCQ